MDCEPRGSDPKITMTQVVSAPLTVERITEAERFRELRAAWDSLAGRDPETHASQCHDWLSLWFAHTRDARPQVFAAWRGGRLTAALPLCAHETRVGLFGIRTLRFAADTDSDYCAALCDPAHPGDLEPLWRALLGRTDWHLLDLRYVVSGSRLAALAGTTVPGTCARRSPYEIAPHLDITADWRESVPKSQRPKLARRRRQLAETGTVAFEVARSPEQVDAMLADLAAIHIARWQERNETSVFRFPERRAWLQAVCREMLHSGCLYLCRLSVDGKPASLGLYFLRNRRLVNYMVAFAEEYRRFGPVHLLILEVIEDARRRDLADVHDFGRGGEEYKLRWTHQSRDVERLLVARRTPLGLCAYHWSASVKPFIWGNPRLATLLREVRRRWELRRNVVKE